MLLKALAYPVRPTYVERLVVFVEYVDTLLRHLRREMASLVADENGA